MSSEAVTDEDFKEFVRCVLGNRAYTRDDALLDDRIKVTWRALTEKENQQRIDFGESFCPALTLKEQNLIKIGANAQSLTLDGVPWPSKRPTLNTFRKAIGMVESDVYTALVAAVNSFAEQVKALVAQFDKLDFFGSQWLTLATEAHMTGALDYSTISRDNSPSLLKEKLVHARVLERLRSKHNLGQILVTVGYGVTQASETIRDLDSRAQELKLSMLPWTRRITEIQDQTERDQQTLAWFQQMTQMLTGDAPCETN
jgi:hypothetical protein